MPRVTESHYVDRLIAVLCEHRVELYLMGIDAEISVVSALRRRIETQTGCHVVVSDDPMIQCATDKLTTAKMLTTLALPAPKTLPGDAAIDAALDQLGLPLFAKPRHGHGSRGIQLIESRADLIERQPRLGDRYCLQEYLPGEEYTCALLYDRKGSLRDWICFRRRLQWGTTIEAQVVQMEALDQLIRRFGDLVQAAGPINLQLRLDKKGTPVIFEINPRFSGTTAFRVACGFNDPLRVALHYLRDEPIERAEVQFVRIFRYFEEWVVPLR
jgi:carbamoyl-phosphate synthase large subunit